MSNHYKGFVSHCPKVAYTDAQQVIYYRDSNAKWQLLREMT